MIAMIAHQLKPHLNNIAPVRRMIQIFIVYLQVLINFFYGVEDLKYKHGKKE